MNSMKFHLESFGALEDFLSALHSAWVHKIEVNQSYVAIGLNTWCRNDLGRKAWMMEWRGLCETAPHGRYSGSELSKKLKHWNLLPVGTIPWNGVRPGEYDYLTPEGWP